MWMAFLNPKGVTFSFDESRRITRVRVAERLGIPPSEVDRMPLRDVDDCLAVWSGDSMIEDSKMRMAR